MKPIRREMTRNRVILLLVTFIFIASSVLVSVGFFCRYNGFLQDYQQVDGLPIISNRRQAYLKLYSKSHDKGMLKQYYGECELFDSQLRGLGEKIRNDRKCKMVYRIVGQIAEHRREMAKSCIRPDGDYHPSLTIDLDKMDLEIERCLNQLMSQYLEYLNTAFANRSRTLGPANSILIVFFMAINLSGMVLNYQMSTSIPNSIKRLTDAAGEIMNSNLEAADIEETPYMKLNQVSAIFDQMKWQIRAMVTELHETHQMKERPAEAKIRELQMQMNPHSLFNTLSLVIRSIQLGGRDISIQLVKAISRILRDGIEINTIPILLDAEIELLQSYPCIQKLYLKGRVTFCLDTRKSLMDGDVMIPPLTIQPLVKNSIQHGLKNRVNERKVDILIAGKPDYIEAVVVNSGVDSPKDPSQPARRDMPISETSVGLKSVEGRLRLFYRKEDMLHIRRAEGVTKITLKLHKSDRHQEEGTMLHVILVDDEQYERDCLEEIVKESYPGLLEIIYKAVDGMDLMEKLEECEPQIVLSGIKMSRMNELKTAEGVRKRYPDVQIMLISAYNDSSFTKQVIRLGATDYLSKSYLDLELRETLDKVTTRARERKDILSMLSYSDYLVEDRESVLSFCRDLEEDLLWDVFSGRRDRNRLEKEFAMWGAGPGWFRVMFIFSPALINMGGFSQEMLKNYLHMAGATMLNSVWMDQMAICLCSQQQDGFTELADCITHARDYLTEERKIPVACGASGACEGMERLTEAYRGVASFIKEHSAQEVRLAFDSMTEGTEQICGLEEQTVKPLSLEDQDLSREFLTEIVEELKTLLGYQDVSVRLNSGRSLMTVIRGINQIPGIRVKTSKAAGRFEKLGQLNFSGGNLGYHVEFFSEMKVQRE